MGELWKWKYDRQWGKPGGGYSDDQESSYVFNPTLDRFEYLSTAPEPKVFFIESSAYLTGRYFYGSAFDG